MTMLLIANASTNIFANEPRSYEIYVKDTKVNPDVTPVTEYSITWVPVSFIAKNLNIDIKYEKSVLTIGSDEDKITWEVGCREYLKNGKKYETSHAPFIVGGRVMLPLRFISEQYGCKVGFESLDDNRLHIIKIGDKGAQPVKEGFVDNPNIIRVLKTVEDISPNGKWKRVHETYTSGETSTLLVDIQTGKVKEIRGTMCWYEGQVYIEEQIEDGKVNYRIHSYMYYPDTNEKQDCRIVTYQKEQ